MENAIYSSFADALRPTLVQDWRYKAIRAVPAWKRLEVSILAIPHDVRDRILQESPSTSTVLVGMHARKGVEYLTFAAGEGSPDELPIVSVVL